MNYVLYALLVLAIIVLLPVCALFIRLMIPITATSIVVMFIASCCSPRFRHWLEKWNSFDTIGVARIICESWCVPVREVRGFIVLTIPHVHLAHKLGIPLTLLVFVSFLAGPMKGPVRYDFHASYPRTQIHQLPQFVVSHQSIWFGCEFQQHW